MSKLTPTLARGVALLALVAAVPLSAEAQGRPEALTGPMHDDRPVGPIGAEGRVLPDDLGLPRSSAPQRLESVPVAAQVSRPTANRCRFVSRVDGRVRALRLSEIDHRDRLAFRPHVTVRSELHCPGAGVRTLVERRVSGGQYLPQQLERSLSRRGEAEVFAGGQVCRLSPTFRFSNGRITGADVAQSCDYARGGGPRR